MAFFDVIIQFGAVVASAIKKETLDITLQVLGIGGIEENSEGEAVPQQVSYGALGLLSRPLPPDTSSGSTYFADVVCLKTSDGLLPIAWRDQRINAAFPAGVKEGSVALAGYGRGFYSLDLTSAASGARKANIHVIYCPYEFNSAGVPAKAHAIILDPTAGNESISITHGEGYQLALTKSDGLLAVLSANTFMRIKPGEFLMQAPKIMLKGNVYLGSQAEAGVPLLAGPASPPSTSIFISP